MFQNVEATVFRFIDVNRHNHGSKDPCRIIHHHGRVMIEQQGDNAIPTVDPQLLTQEGHSSIDGVFELLIGIASNHPGIVVIG